MQLVKTIATEIPTWAKNTLLVVGASLLLGLFAHVAIPLPFTPVPLATQGSLVLLLAIVLGSKRATAAVALFLAQGALGLPVFANGATAATLMGPRAGYLLGYLLAAYVTAKIIELAKTRTLFSAFLAMLAGDALILLCGAIWLTTFIGPQKALLLGVAPFVVGDLLKIALSLKLLQWTRWSNGL